MRGKLVCAAALLVLGGCRACSNCCDYLPPVATGHYYVPGARVGSAFSGSSPYTAHHEDSVGAEDEGDLSYAPTTGEAIQQTAATAELIEMPDPAEMPEPAADNEFTRRLRQLTRREDSAQSAAHEANQTGD